jgi:hypothetical protein
MVVYLLAHEDRTGIKLFIVGTVWSSADISDSFQLTASCFGVPYALHQLIVAWVLTQIIVPCSGIRESDKEWKDALRLLEAV